MKLPIPFLKSKKEESEYYLSLILTDEKAGALILKADEGNLKRVNSSESFFPESLDEITLNDLVATIDKAISRAEEVLPPDIQTHQTIFGVKDSWVDNETKKIKKEYLEQLKKVCNSLDLIPIGFMVTTEAIMHLMQEEEGAPVSAVFAEIGKKYVNLSLLRGGKVLETVSSPHLESVPLTVDKLLGHFTVPVLPARIVIFQSKPSERTSHAFLSHQWSKHLPFLHLPQVTVLPSEFDMRSVLAGTATQMGFTVVESKVDILPKLSANTLKDELEEAGSLKESQTNVEEGDVDEETLTNLSRTEEADNFADSQGKISEQEVADSEAASDFGFVINQDISTRKPSIQENEQEDLPSHTMHDEAFSGIEEPESTSSRRKKGNGVKLPLLSSLPAIKLPKNLKLPEFGGLSGIFKGKQTALKIIVPLVVIIILIAGAIYFYYDKMQANVLLTMTPNSESQDETVTFSTAESNDFSNNLIAAKNISTSIAGQATVNATGSKNVGDKAKGTVTIYNNNENSVTLNSGTSLTASNGQVFLLDNTVTVASASGDIFSGTTPGTTQTTVTAKDLGTDGNEPSGTEFSIGTDSTVAAKNDNAFSGGTTKNVTVVSESDIASLRSQLLKSVQSSAQQKLEAQADSGSTVLPLIGSPTLSGEVFNHHVDDQATQVSLNASVDYTGMEYADSDLDSFAKTIMKNKFPQDPNIANNSVKETINDAQQRTSQAATATVSIQAGLLPDINNQDVISLVQKKSLGDARNALGNIPQVQSADITFSPPIPLLPLLFPSLPHHINVTVKSQ